MTTKEGSTSTSQSPTRRDVLAGVSIGIGGLALRSASASAASATEEISRSAESIHQKVSFKAGPERVYAALVDARLFQQVTLLSAAVESGMVQPTRAAEIQQREGGAFSLFGGHISGRIIELLPNRRLVQAWRPQDWAPGVYSIVRFQLESQGTGTSLVFDHTGFPLGQAETLAAGWKGNYWEPIEKFLAA
ncbi:MAG: SRPBCC domain-containing protein [Pseudomonadota bacterium]